MENSANATSEGERGDNGQDQEEADRPGIELIEDDDGPMPVPQMPLDDVKESNSKKTVEIIDDDEDDPWSSSILQPRVYQEAIVGEEIAKKGKVLDEHQNRETVDADIDTTVDGDDDMFEEFSWVGYLEPSPPIVTTPPPPSDPAPTENNNNNSILPIGEELNDIEVGRQSAALSNHDEEQSESEPASLLELKQHLLMTRFMMQLQFAANMIVIGIQRVKMKMKMKMKAAANLQVGGGGTKHMP